MNKACKPNPRDTEKLAQKIKKEYAYMNTLPRHGWLWEIIRRSNDYREKCRAPGSNGDSPAGHFDLSTPGVYTPGTNGSTRIPDPRWRYVDFQRNGRTPPYVSEASPIKMALCPTDEGYIDARQSPKPDIREAVWELFSVKTQTTRNDTVYLGVSVNAKLEEAR